MKTCYLVIAKDSTNLFPVYSLFSTKEKAQAFFAKELESYWPKSEWNGESYDIDGKTAAECIDEMYYIDEENSWMQGIPLGMNSGIWED